MTALGKMLLEALAGIKRTTMNKRMFGGESLSEWRNAATTTEGDAEDALKAAKVMMTQPDIDTDTLANFRQVRRLDQWHEDHGSVLWWRLTIEEPPYAGTPLDSDWPGYHTHWTPIPTPAI